MRESRSKIRKRAYVEGLKAQKKLPPKDFNAMRLKKLGKELTDFRSALTLNVTESELYVYVISDIDRLLDTLCLIEN